MNVRRVLLAGAAAVLAGCSSDPEAPAPVTPRAGDVFLGEAALWMASPRDLPDGACYGTSVALGDLDGDGHPELAVATPRCAGAAEPGPGHVALHAGRARFFAETPIFAQIDWQSANPNTSSRGLAVAAGRVDGDARADLLVRGRYGVLVFAGTPDLAGLLSAPLFRVPGDETFGPALLADVNGDGFDDLVSVSAGTTTVYLATPGEAAPFSAARTVPGAWYARAAGDVNGDGAEDVLLDVDVETQLFLGCPAGSPLACDGGLTSAPRWSVARVVLGTAPDQNDDGMAEVLLGQPHGGYATGGRLALHLSDADAGVSPAPVWSALGDPLFLDFGRQVVQPGDMNGDGRAAELLVGAFGRVYAFFPEQGISSELAPAWAWPRKDTRGPLRITNFAAAGDLNGDGFADVLAGAPPEYGSTRPGKVLVYGGGQVPPSPAGAPPPYLPEPISCAFESGGLPDMTIDESVLARSLYLEDKEFAPESCEVAEGCVLAPGPRRLLRFSVSIANLGPAPLLIPGPEEAPELYQYDTCHEHDHLVDFASYELRDAGGGVLAAGRKQGFNFVDSAPYCMDAVGGVDYYPSLGISAGWSDVYDAVLPCQWLDVTELPDGAYTLRVAADENDLIVEDDVLPNAVELALEIRDGRVTVID